MQTPIKSEDDLYSHQLCDGQDHNDPQIQNVLQNSSVGDAQLGARPKRLQAQRACSNCKRLHARCDNERPCKRCAQNGLASSCVDLPRKRRMSRTYEAWESRFPVGANRVPGPFTPTGMSLTPPWVPGKDMKITTGKPGYEGVPSGAFDQNLILTEIVNSGDDNPPPRPNPTSQHIQSTFGSPQPVSPATSTPPTSSPSFEKQDPMMERFLYQQMTTELKENGQFDKKNPFASEYETEPRTGTYRTQWHSFIAQQEFAISVWKGTSTPGINFLVECNERFVELVGYSLDQLKNNFPCQKLFISKAFCGQKDFPKRTQIATSSGYKEVYLTIYPLIGENATNKYFIVNMLELSSSFNEKVTYAPEPASFLGEFKEQTPNEARSESNFSKTVNNAQAINNNVQHTNF